MSRNILALFIFSIVYLEFVTSRTRNHCHLIRCGNRGRPVCGTDGKTYRSMCHFVRVLCIRDKSVHPRVQRQGLCRKSFVCSLPKDGGRCHLNRKRYYFNRNKRRCLPFRYGGCYGNRNNFATYRACRRFCGRYAVLDELDKYETPSDRTRQEAITRYNSLDFNGEEIEDYNERFGDEIVPDEGQDEDENRNERGFGEGDEDDVEEDDRNEEDYPFDAHQEGDIEDGNEENVNDYNEDEDGAFENEIEYVNKMQNEKESRKETKNKVDAIADAKRMKPSTKRKYPSCEKGLCELNITPVGCFRDSHQAVRPLPHLIDSHRDTTSHAHHGVSIDWKNFNSTIRKLACDCVRIARERNYTHIGLQNYGECWAGNVTNKQYAINGKSENCLNGTYKPCENGTFCIGKEKTNYVYKIEPTIPACHIKYEKIGCFHDPVKTDNRPLPELLDSHRDRTSNSFHGLSLDWKNYRTSLKILIDHCAERTRSKGYSHFGIQHYGECWSGEEADKTYSLYGNSTNCVNADYEKCNSNYACQCAGKENANYVYRLK